jgi:hypothetical protein
LFYFRLAHELNMTVSQLLENCTSSELTEWGGYFKLLERERIEEELKSKAQEKMESMKHGKKNSTFRS